SRSPLATIVGSTEGLDGGCVGALVASSGDDGVGIAVSAGCVVLGDAALSACCAGVATGAASGSGFAASAGRSAGAGASTPICLLSWLSVCGVMACGLCCVA